MGFVCFQRMILADYIGTTLKHCKSQKSPNDKVYLFLACPNADWDWLNERSSNY